MRSMGIMGVMGIMLLVGCGNSPATNVSAQTNAPQQQRISDYKWQSAIELIREQPDPIRADLEKTLAHMAKAINCRPDLVGYVDIVDGLCGKVDLLCAWQHVPENAREAAMAKELRAIIEEARRQNAVPSAICAEYVSRRLDQIRPAPARKPAPEDPAKKQARESAAEKKRAESAEWMKKLGENASGK